MADPPDDGVHIRAMVRQDSAQTCAMTVDIWPLPLNVLPGLTHAIQNAVIQYLMDARVISDEVIDLHKTPNGHTH